MDCEEVQPTEYARSRQLQLNAFFQQRGVWFRQLAWALHVHNDLTYDRLLDMSEHVLQLARKVGDHETKEIEGIRRMIVRIRNELLPPNPK